MMQMQMPMGCSLKRKNIEKCFLKETLIVCVLIVCVMIEFLIVKLMGLESL